MSTKTSIKRVALVAVSALGFGVLGSVNAYATDITFTAPTVAAATTNVGQAVSVPVTFGALSADIDAACAITFTPTSQTSAGIGTATFANTTLTAGTAGSLGWAVTATGTGALTMTAATTFTNATKTLTDAKIVGSFTFTPTKAGVYTVSVASTSTGAGCTTGDEPAAVTFSLTVGPNSSLAAIQGDGGAPALNNSVSGVAGPANFVTAELVIPTTVSSTIRRLVVADAGVRFLNATTTNASGGTNTNTTTISEDKQSVEVVAVQDSTAKTAHGRSEIRIATPTAGTYSVRVFNGAQAGIYGATASETITITVAAAASNGTLSVSNSTTLLDKDATAGGSYAAPAADEAVSVVRTAGTAAGVVRILLKDVLNNNMPDTTTVSVTVSGPGLIALDSTQASATYANASRAESGTLSSGGTWLAIYADGTSGVGTITIAVGTTVVSTETVTFFGAGAKYVATVYKSTVASSGSASADAVCVTVTDSNGVVVPNHRVFADLGTSTVATIEVSDLSDALGDACFDVTGLAAKSGPVAITFRNAATAAAATVTTTSEVTVSSVRAATLTITTDKATYAPGEKITFTLTAKDSNGYGIPTGSYAADALLKNLATNPVMSFGFSTTPFLGTASVSIKGGVATATGFAPLVSGPVSLSWTLAGTLGGAAITNLSAALVGTTVTASANVTASAAETAAEAAADAAAEAIDAANAATDAANLAAEAADAATVAAEEARDAADAATAAVEELASQVATLMAALKAQITTLANTVAKIAKRVRA